MRSQYLTQYSVRLSIILILRLAFKATHYNKTKIAGLIVRI